MSGAGVGVSFLDGLFRGLVEFSLVIPFAMPHFVREG